MFCSRRQFLTECAAAVSITLIPRQGHAEAAFTFAQLCDTQLGMGGYEHDVQTFRQAVADLNTLKPDFVVICGDLINETNSDQAFADFNEIKAGFEMPCYCAAGNHDISNAPTPALLARYRKLVGDDVFQFQHKGCTFLVVNTQLWKSPMPGETEKQDAWLREALKAAAERTSPVFIVGHYPPFIKDPMEAEEYFNLPVETRRQLLALFKAHNVVAVTTGHTHRNEIARYDGIQFVSSATTSKNFDGAPFGFRLWHIKKPSPYEHEYVPLTKYSA